MDFYSNNYDLLTNSERVLLHYILDHIDTIKNMTSQKLATQCGVSKTVVINMCQKLGFEGYNDLRFFLKNQDKEKEPLESTETFEFRMIDIVTQSIQVNKHEVLEKIAKMIIRSNCIYLIARGTSKPIASYLNHILLTLNIKCINIPDLNLMQLVAQKMTHDEVLMAISLSGRTPLIIETAKAVKAYGNTLISLTSFSDNPLNHYSDLQLFCSSESNDTKINDVNIRIGMFAVIDLLVHYIKIELSKK
ncbi:MurR/RpiR family transcriptional regulator [uncultured Traorella sp.]|uniref:MurR/RpiR family transcriptional regulator n=1 Tax=uncultured Traorella sp. TaxID=1929048 RepID=UPI00260039F8|nr:MurR/RpiR family transcriptional regulator [uncultured Traorella sp.]